MHKLRIRLHDFLADGRGVTALEYCFIGGVVAVVMVVGASVLGTSLSGTFSHVAGSV